MMQIFRSKTIARVNGFSLIEVMVAMILLVIGVLGAASMQLNALKYSQTSGARTQAAFLAYSIVDMMRANSVAAKANKYNIALQATPVDTGSIASKDLVAWNNSVKGQLPSGTAAVLRQPQLNAAGQTVDVVTVTLQWDEGRVGGNSNNSAESAAAASPDLQQFVFVTQL